VRPSFPRSTAAAATSTRARSRRTAPCCRAERSLPGMTGRPHGPHLRAGPVGPAAAGHRGGPRELLAARRQRVVLMTLVADVARTHFDLLELDDELEIARRTLQTRQASLELQRRRFEQGLSTQLDVDRAEAECRGRRHRTRSGAPYCPDRNGLSVLLGRNPVRSLARLRSTGNACPRRCRRGYPRRCSSAGLTFARPNRRSSPPTRGSRGEGGILPQDHAHRHVGRRERVAVRPLYRGSRVCRSVPL